MASSRPSSSRRPARQDLTPLFRQLLASAPACTEPHPSPHSHPPSSQKQGQQAAWRARRAAEHAWNAEASKLRRNIDDLCRFVAQVRRPYLQSGPVFPVRVLGDEEAEEENQPATGAAATAGLERYGRLRHLSEEEKNEVDLHLKLVLEKGVARVKELIKAEEVRQLSQPTPQSSTLSSTSVLTRLLSRPLPPTSLDSLEYSKQLASHREAITASLGASLKRVGERVGHMQESRARGRVARGGKRSQHTSGTGGDHSILGRKEGSERGQVKAIQGSTASFRALAPTSANSRVASSSSSMQSKAPHEVGEEVEELTQAQLQVFQSESSALTKSLQADLSALEGVTSTLTTISSLQTTLIQHLSTQNETIVSLGSEAGEHRVEVEKGNEQLRKARQRNRSANRMLGALLVGSGLGLLFLHVMD